MGGHAGIRDMVPFTIECVRSAFVPDAETMIELRRLYERDIRNSFVPEIADVILGLPPKDDATPDAIVQG